MNMTDWYMLVSMGILFILNELLRDGANRSKLKQAAEGGTSIKVGSEFYRVVPESKVNAWERRDLEDKYEEAPIHLSKGAELSESPKN